MEKTVLMNMCMIYDDDGNILVQDRVKKNWPGVSFPGGHVEPGEAIITSVIREVKEETGLDISDLRICGIKDWYNSNTQERALVFLFKTNKFKGQLLDETVEGKVFWIKKGDIFEYKLADNFAATLEVFFKEDINEFFFDFKEGKWYERLL